MHLNTTNWFHSTASVGTQFELMFCLSEFLLIQQHSEYLSGLELLHNRKRGEDCLASWSLAWNRWHWNSCQASTWYSSKKNIISSLRPNNNTHNCEISSNTFFIYWSPKVSKVYILDFSNKFNSTDLVCMWYVLICLCNNWLIEVIFYGINIGWFLWHDNFEYCNCFHIRIYAILRRND